MPRHVPLMAMTRNNYSRRLIVCGETSSAAVTHFLCMSWMPPYARDRLRLLAKNMRRYPLAARSLKGRDKHKMNVTEKVPCNEKINTRTKKRNMNVVPGGRFFMVNSTFNELQKHKEQTIAGVRCLWQMGARALWGRWRVVLGYLVYVLCFKWFWFRRFSLGQVVCAGAKKEQKSVD